MRSRQIALLSLLALFGYAVPALAAQPAKTGFDEKAIGDFYRGKTVRIVVGFSAGGGYDQYSRVIARHLSKLYPAIRL